MKRYERIEIMHRVVEHNGVLHFAGVVANDLSKDLKGQTEEVCMKITKLLEAHGSDTSKIISATIFIVNMNEKSKMNEAWVSWLKAEDLPTRATIGVADLGKNVLIEVILTAAAR